ncbi:MAG: FAD-dependent oxidoreductase, partial [Acidobacteriaceae bacterium]|nr:FAD-dependent oxidoreductase [Acidobacteriaceae bacterium]
MRQAQDNESYDVCVIGSGPAGGVLSKELAEAGAKVALIEGGRTQTAKDFHFHAWPYEFPKRVKPSAGYPQEVVDSIHYEDCDAVQMDRIRAVGGR